MFDMHQDDANLKGASGESANTPKPDEGYLGQADAAKVAKPELAMHLYLSAYESLSANSPIVPDAAIEALREAWSLACSLKERSMAEYVYDRLEPHLSDAELEEFNAVLQELAFDKASEFGFSRDELDRISDIISESIGEGVELAGVEALDLPEGALEAMAQGFARLMEAGSAEAAEQASGPEGSESALVQEGSSADAPTPVSALSASEGAVRPSPSQPAEKQSASKKPAAKRSKKREAKHPNFSDLVGYDSVIEDLHSLGIGIQNDESYREIMNTLRERHGLDKVSSAGSVVFRASARSDAAEFMEAAANEIDLPAMRMRMQSGTQGFPVLSFTVSADRPPRFGSNRMTIESPSVLILEDVDLWMAPMEEALGADEDSERPMPMPTQAAYQTFAWIRAAVENPDVYVFASIGAETNDSGFLYDLLEPIDVVEIYMPDEVERRRIWKALAQWHPSIRELDFSSLTRMSRNLARTDIVMAVRDALEDAYRQGMRARRYVPVTQGMMFEHLANFQPLDSAEYRTMEAAVLEEFRGEIAQIELGREDEASWPEDTTKE